MCNRIGTIVKQKGASLTVIRLRCKSWNCKDCSRMRRNKLIKEAHEGKPERFITLTVNPNWYSSPEERAIKLVQAWRKVRRRFIELPGNRTLEFLAVFELTKKGEPHLHIMQRGSFIPQKWLSAQMNKEIGAPIVDVRTVKGAKEVAKYVSKYISKRNVKIGTLKRYWRSIKYHAQSTAEKKRIKNKGAQYYILDCHYWQYVAELQKRAMRLTRIGNDVTEAEYAWEDDPPPWCINVVPAGGGKKIG